MQGRHSIQFSTQKLPCISDSLLQLEQASSEKHVKASFWLHCRVLQTSLLPYKAAVGVRGPLNQLLCGSVNRVNVTHFVENCTSTPASFGPILYGLANKPGPCNGCLITQTYEQQRQEDKEMSPNMDRKCTSTFV